MRLPPSMAPICTVGSMNLCGIFALIFFLPILNRLGDFAGGENELGRFAVDAHPRPEQTRVADLQLQAGGLADDAHIGHHAVVHQIARADAGAAILFAVEAADLGLFDLADHAGDDQIALELHAGFLQRRHRFDVAGKRRLHVDQAAAVDAVVVDHGLLRRVEVVHVRVEHQGRAAAGAFERADDIGPAVFDVLILDLHAEFFELAAEIFGDIFLIAGDADDVGEITRHLDDSLAIDLFQHFFLH